MTYREFNENVLRFYLERAKTSLLTFAIDSAEFSSIVNTADIRSFEILKGSWAVLINSQPSIPLYFGLLALQSYAAYLMQDDEEMTENAYLPRLQYVLGLKGINIQTLFRESYENKTVQETLWFEAKRHLNRYYGLNLQIPEPRSHKGKYIQYPLSQLLLKKEDLKDFTVFFAEHFLPGENISHHFFSEALLAWPRPRISPRAANLLSDPEKRGACIIQIFNYFQIWDGEVFGDRIGSNDAIKLSKYINKASSNRLILGFEKDIPLFIYVQKVISAESIFSLKDFHYFYEGILLFNPMPPYEDEFQYTRFLYKDTDCYIVLNKSKRVKESDFFNKRNVKEVKISDEVSLYKYHISDLEPYNPLTIFFYLHNPVQLSGGVRLSQNNAFLIGFGPNIHCGEAFSVLFNFRAIEYSPKKALEGEYVVRTPGYKDVSFYIEDVKTSESIPSAGMSGWDLVNISPTNYPRLEGCCFFSVNKGHTHPIRAWINNYLEKQIRCNNQLSIQRLSNYGRRQTSKGERNL